MTPRPSAGWKPLARIVGAAGHAQAPEWFTTQPAGAIVRKPLARTGWKKDDVDLWEINEAFAVVSIANNRILGLDPARVNVWGGAVALGHPIGASGARVLVTLLFMALRDAGKSGASPRCASAAARASRSPSSCSEGGDAPRDRCYDEPEMTIEHIGVIGAGQMGRGIAQLAASHGLDVTLVDVGRDVAERGAAPSRSSFARLAGKQKITEAQRDRTMARIRPADLYAGDLEAVDFVVEAATETIEIKREIFVALDRACRGGVILATNTSSISITAIGASVKRPDRVIGMQLHEPAAAS